MLFKGSLESSSYERRYASVLSSPEILNFFSKHGFSIFSEGNMESFPTIGDLSLGLSDSTSLFPAVGRNVASVELEFYHTPALCNNLEGTTWDIDTMSTLWVVRDLGK
jgi:hypothetical protein